MATTGWGEPMTLRVPEGVSPGDSFQARLLPPLLAAFLLI